ncbi:MAG: type II toxin-antitoxin system VapC family toxin [Rhodopirellula sp.]|nr:type II toxin-antitoxin system VapC family toxin [Rhodopirellula sp.]
MLRFHLPLIEPDLPFSRIRLTAPGLSYATTGTAIARQLRDDYRDAVYTLLAQDVFPAEVAHPLARAERRNIIPAGDAATLLANLMTTAPQFHSYRPLLPRALAIASRMSNSRRSPEGRAGHGHWPPRDS